MAQAKLQEGDMVFVGGQNSLLDPVLLPPGSYPRSVNTVNRGGVVQCRPGYRTIFALPPGNQQGGELLFPKEGPTVLVFAVSGQLYASEAPFKSFRQLTGVQFSPTAKQLFFKRAEQSVTNNADGSISFLERPKKVLIIQDGGDAQAAVFDGSSAAHSADIPAGGPMAWVGDRLWVLRGSQVFPSDVGNPLSFIEWQFIANAPQYLILPGRGVAISEGPSSAIPQLFVWTESGTTLIQAGLRNRSVWVTTPDFQREIFPNVGCVGQRSVVNHYGMLWWFSGLGLTSLDAAAQTHVSSTLPYKDAQMSESKGRLASDLSVIASAGFENYLLVSVPNSDKFNSHTWVMDNTPLEASAVPTWNSVWTGTRPVCWMTGKILGKDKCLFISNDYDGQARLWEAFTPDRLDNGCPITGWIETRAVSHGIIGKNKEFRYGDVYMSELDGPVDVAIFWAGAHRGKYKRIQTKRINASRGNLIGEVGAHDVLFELKKQARLVRTQDGRTLYTHETQISANVESPNAEFKDEAFQILIVFSGPCAIRGYNLYVEPPQNDDDQGRVEPPELEENYVRFDGAASENLEDLRALELFTSNRTIAVTQDGQTEIGSASVDSLISQANADRVAEAIARRKASEALSLSLPKIVSLGAKANEI